MGFFEIIYEAGITTELFPLLIFVGIGAMTDFGPLLENPKIFLLGAAGQFGIFLTLALALALGFTKLEAVSIGIIGACDGPTAIYVTSQYAPASSGSRLGGCLLLYVSRSYHPAPDHEGVDDQRRENDQYGHREKIRLQRRRGSSSHWS